MLSAIESTTRFILGLETPEGDSHISAARRERIQTLSALRDVGCSFMFGGSRPARLLSQNIDRRGQVIWHAA